MSNQYLIPLLSTLRHIATNLWSRKRSCTVLAVSMAMLWSSAAMAEQGNRFQAPDSVLEIGRRIFTDGIDSAVETPIPGVFELTSGTSVIYVSRDGKFAIEGDIFDLEAGKNLTEVKRNHTRINAIDGLGEKSMIVFAPDEVEHTITVFTDVDCGYCRKLHNQMDKFNNAGIKVRYLGFPRAGISSDTYDIMVSIWCADDRQKAMTDAKNGDPIPSKKCDHPIKEHFELGKQIGIRGTPAIALEDGTLIAGYLPVARLKKILEEKSK